MIPSSPKPPKEKKVSAVNVFSAKLKEKPPDVVEADYSELTEAKHYQQLETIGASRRSQVILAYCEATDERVAIKQINLETVDSDPQWENLTKEANLLSQMKHPNLVSSRCSFLHTREDGDPELWIVMPIMAGSCQSIIANWRPNGIKDEHVLAFILNDTLKGLQYLHDNNYIHRDVKASNILISIKGVARLSDFAVTSIPKDERTNVKRTLTGTPCWISPEVWKGKYDAKADIWSFGILALELAFGRPPFAHYDRQKLMLLALDESPYPPIHQIYSVEEVAAFSKSFIEMVKKCLNKNPTKRVSATELLKDKFFQKAIDRVYVQNVVKPMLSARNDAKGNIVLVPKSVDAEKTGSDSEAEGLVPLLIGSGSAANSRTPSPTSAAASAAPKPTALSGFYFPSSDSSISFHDSQSAPEAGHESAPEAGPGPGQDGGDDRNDGGDGGKSDAPDFNAKPPTELSSSSLLSRFSPSSSSSKKIVSAPKSVGTAGRFVITESTPESSPHSSVSHSSETTNQLKLEAANANNANEETGKNNVRRKRRSLSSGPLDRTSIAEIRKTKMLAQRSSSSRELLAQSSLKSEDHVVIDRKTKGRFIIETLPTDTSDSDGPAVTFVEPKKPPISDRPEAEARRHSGRFIVEPLAESKQLQTAPEVSHWSVEEVQEWLLSLGKDYVLYGDKFVGSGVDGDMLLSITDEMLKELDVEKSVHRKKIMNSINKLKQPTTSAAAADPIPEEEDTNTTETEDLLGLDDLQTLQISSEKQQKQHVQLQEVSKD